MMDADDIPTADQVARAFVLSARELGDAERLAKAARSPAAYRGLTMRARWVALDACLTLWPRFGMLKLARLLGGLPNSAYASMESARQAKWWSAALVDRVIAGI